MRIDCLSIFPEMIAGGLDASIVGKAQQRDLLTINQWNIRDFAEDKHHTVDDIPYGGGVGMVFRPEPTVAALRHVWQPHARVIHPSPAAPPFTQAIARELAQESHLIFIASRYEGLDQRVIDGWVDAEYSLGDYVISGGELAAAVMIDATARLVPGVIGKSESFQQDSFYQGLLDYPHYTRPPDFEGRKVPDILLSGHHERVRKWRKRQALMRTKALRPDLLKHCQDDDEAQAILRALDDE